MIPITPLSNRTVLLNIRSIEQIEETPDTVLVLTGGRRMVVIDMAADVVDRINHVRAQILASAVTSRRSSTTDTATPPPAGLRLLEPSNVSTSHNPDTGQVSNTNPMHAGQIAIDRTLAAVARCTWLIDQETTRNILKRELGKAVAAVEELSHSATQADDAIAARVEKCKNQLVALYHQTQDGTSTDNTRHTLRRINSSLKRLRKAWATVAADTWSHGPRCSPH